MSLLGVVRQIMVTQIYVLATLDGAGVLSDSEGGFVVYRKGDGAMAEHAHVSEDLAEPCGLFYRHSANYVFSFAGRERSEFLFSGAP